MLVIPGHAKINLALEVVSRRDDGWHDIESVLVPIDWHDLLGVGFHSGPTPAMLRVTGRAARGVPGARVAAAERSSGEASAADLTRGDASAARTNLAVRAIESLLMACEAADPLSFSLWLDKRVPIAAGLGGGSADAAAALIAGARLLGREGVAVAPALLSSLAGAIGSDVPALLARCPVHVSGRGERTTATAMPQLHLVVAFLGPSLTRVAYEMLQPGEMSSGARVHDLLTELRTLARRASAMRPNPELLGSALEAPALRASPALAAATRRLRALTPALRWHMTGSGGSFFAVMPDAVAAAELAARLRSDGVLARACRSLACRTPWNRSIG